MVGLPARGKTYISRKLCRYLNWLGISTKVFNVGNYRRKISGAEQSHHFFDSRNSQGAQQRQQAAIEALQDMLSWLSIDGEVAFYDATNTTKARREIIFTRCQQGGVHVMEVKLTSPDYVNMNPEKIVSDFKARISHYQESIHYQSFKRLHAKSHRLLFDESAYSPAFHSFLQSNNATLNEHGESEFNLLGRLGGDSDLSENGKTFAALLPEAVANLIGSKPLTVWTSTLTRTSQTAHHLQYPKLKWKALDELSTGVCDGMTYEEIQKAYPEDFAERDNDKFNYRYRGGESYHDLVIRLEPVIMELERQQNILIIGHQAVLRCLFAYFLNIPPKELPYIKIPLHTLIKFTPKAYGCEQAIFKMNVKAVDTHRGQEVNVEERHE